MSFITKNRATAVLNGPITHGLTTRLDHGGRIYQPNANDAVVYEVGCLQKQTILCSSHVLPKDVGKRFALHHQNDIVWLGMKFLEVDGFK